MTIFYKSYPYAPKATALSALCSCVCFLAVVGAICMIALGAANSFLWIVLGVVLLAGAAALYFLVYRKAIPRKAREETQKNIATKGSFAAMYCRQHPDAYEQLMQTNPDFAQKYTRNEKGKIVKQK